MLLHVEALLERLHGDHRRFAKLLDFLDGEIEKLRAGGDADLERLHDALVYFEDYPSSLVHHPREDLLTERLAERSVENQPVRGSLDLIIPVPLARDE